MAEGEGPVGDLISAIVAGDDPAVRDLLAAHPDLTMATMGAGATRAEARAYFIDEIRHYVYAGDTALHIAAAAHSPDFVSALTSAGADVRAANRRGAQPLHYAVDGGPDAPRWDPVAQAETVRLLIAAGADPNAVDKGGTTPLHRAIRNRCASAVETLLALGADSNRPNGRGSMPMQVARWTTGKSGSGSAAAKAQQVRIVQLLDAQEASRR